MLLENYKDRQAQTVRLRIVFTTIRKYTMASGQLLSADYCSSRLTPVPPIATL
jgi:hypothetical protein